MALRLTGVLRRLAGWVRRLTEVIILAEMALRLTERDLRPIGEPCDWLEWPWNWVGKP